MASAELRGVDTVRRGLAQAGRIFEEEYREASEASLRQLAADLADYPPQPAGSSYVRTKRLQRGWTGAQPVWRPIGNGYTAQMANATPYGPVVQVAEMQAWIHQGRWLTDEAALAQRKGEVEARHDEATQRAADRIAAGG